MMDIIDAIFDHAFVVSAADRVMMEMFFPGEEPAEMLRHYQSYIDRQLERYCATADKVSLKLPRTRQSEQDKDGMKIVPVPFSPTAENMAAYMFRLSALEPREIGGHRPYPCDARDTRPETDLTQHCFTVPCTAPSRRGAS